MIELEYKSDFLEVSYDSANSWVVNKWTDNTRYLTIDQYKQETLALLKVFVDHQPLAGILSLTQDFHFVVDPEMQEWITKIFEGYLPSKSAIVVGSEFVSQLSIEQTVQDLDVIVRYFDNESEAKEWLLDKTKMS
ncbi:hypothetical protein [Microscilla marina]|uniref:STAS/SEC14 domain-containing protein n=1 Tax=Microscilla marina ATCC 23134 TaxID=313606 RepID=A1ZGD7_MICM2|nr:hypothetical protein [Microscilla marina]EAY30554.1 hypothetical protein M23134_03192 [Microscilla marina ATCC 23134]